MPGKKSARWTPAILDAREKAARERLAELQQEEKAKKPRRGRADSTAYEHFTAVEIEMRRREWLRLERELRWVERLRKRHFPS